MILLEASLKPGGCNGAPQPLFAKAAGDRAWFERLLHYGLRPLRLAYLFTVSAQPYPVERGNKTSPSPIAACPVAFRLLRGRDG